ncbi:MAG TPA: PEP-CTERM sorting domain-containing protein [Rhizomicrobium sp.]|nr:PEP-CTERM sorting domain-containing protein [Rhizomicrobium sp.]
MKRFGFAFIAAAALTIFGGTAANALPFPPTLFQPTAGGVVPFEDRMFIFKPGAGLIEDRMVTHADINGCANVLVGGCLFTVPNPLGLAFNPSQQDRLTLVYEPDGITLSDIFGVTCNGDTCNLAFLSRIGNQAIDLTGVNTSDWYAVTELAGVPSTIFDATYYLDHDFLLANPGSFARFVSANEVPEPATLTLFGAGALGAAVIRRRRKRG